MVGKTKHRTKADQDHLNRITELGCICCLKEGEPGTPAERHHITDRGRRIGHQAALPLCAWHHRGVPTGNLAPSRMELLAGPSLAISKTAFVRRYGTERQLLDELEHFMEHGDPPEEVV